MFTNALPEKCCCILTIILTFIANFCYKFTDNLIYLTFYKRKWQLYNKILLHFVYRKTILVYNINIEITNFTGGFLIWQNIVLIADRAYPTAIGFVLPAARHFLQPRQVPQQPPMQAVVQLRAQALRRQF
jgi:hypothetical protein